MLATTRKLLLPVLTLILSALTLSACGKPFSNYNATGLTEETNASSVSMSFDTFKGIKEYSVRSGKEDNMLKCHGRLISGTITVYCDYDDVKREVMVIRCLIRKYLIMKCIVLLRMK